MKWDIENIDIVWRHIEKKRGERVPEPTRRYAEERLKTSNVDVSSVYAETAMDMLDYFVDYYNHWERR